MSPALKCSLCPILESLPGILEAIVGLPSCENARVE